MRDGARLAARLWLPVGAWERPVPAIFEFIPYRKRDAYRKVDDSIHPYFAARNYGCVRVDLRGSGESDGVLTDEYSPQELDDALEVIRWIGRQAWCSGAVGMMGISWGAFNALQVAALQPPELKAVIAVSFSDDRYANDVHYMGGCMLLDNVSWAAQMASRLTRPPDPEIVGHAWRAMWIDRLEKTPALLLEWMRHQRRDAYWKRGSVCEDYAAIRCPVLAVSGWADPYRNSVPRLLSSLTGFRRGIIGPWAHDYPHTAIPGPRIGFLQEAQRWWDHWLKDFDTGIADEPLYRVWMQEGTKPAPFSAERRGRWVAEAAWPLPDEATGGFFLVPGRLTRQAPDTGADLHIRSPQTTGRAFGKWCPYGNGPEMPLDQRQDDTDSLCFETDPLDAGLEILGAPVFHGRLAADAARALICARVTDVAPDGASTLVSYGLLNLAHRDSHEEPTPIMPGEMFSVAMKLNETAYAFPPGHRIRLALSTSYWPIAWPAPDNSSVAIRTRESRLLLPVRTPRGDEALPTSFQAPVVPERRTSTLRNGNYERRYATVTSTGETVIEAVTDQGVRRIDEIGLTMEGGMIERYSIHPDDPLSARIEVTSRDRISRDDWSATTTTRTSVTSTSDAFEVEVRLEAWDGEALVVSRTEKETIARDLL
ncbi:MAG: CocE/NonD family hydrolase [Rhizobiales bacterium]|nr:CocE/NonD family hydrolase [Hyphomicrobiales bacterium]